MAAAALGSSAWPSRCTGQPTDRFATRRGASQSNGGPELALINGLVYTVDEAKPAAQAFAVKHGRFFAIGSTEEIRQLITSDTQG